MAETDNLEWGKQAGSEEDGEEKRDVTEWDMKNEEVADMGELDYDYSSVEQKIAAGLKEKEKGNILFQKGEYEKAWKQYDTCFVHVYTSKEEWVAIGPEGRASINNFKVPIHLNRGLCRLRKKHFDNALWDFNEALRIDENNVKGLYRKGLVLTRIIESDMAKEGSDELWDLDVAEGRANEARTVLMKAVKLSPGDINIRNALQDLKTVRDELAEHRKKYRANQKKLYSTFISNLDKENARIREEEEKSVFDDLPQLERVRIE